MKTFIRVFQHTSWEASRALVGLRQGRRRAADYAIEFRTLAAKSGWTQSALHGAFLHGISSPLKDQLDPLDLPDDLNALIALTVKINKWISKRKRTRFSFLQTPERLLVPPLFSPGAPQVFHLCLCQTCSRSRVLRNPCNSAAPV